ncbi:proteasome subunit beta type-5-like [Centruroides sculpturatus]|uniref:proteasome subunit beta type-5-like n=1 Tax=Centruroides sculpturatus TaxID=218467 RepID=UPI000C6E9308|nr:proteasome subunit beta type-5-like [Centruroides sculpturatus]
MALEALVSWPKNFHFGRMSEIQNGLTLNEDFIGNSVSRTAFALPPVSEAALGIKDIKICDSGKRISINYNKGTTTLAFKYKGGIVIAVDSRATSGSYIGSQTIKKIIEINEYLLGTMAGGAADCVYWQRVLGEKCRIYELRNKERISVAAASKLLANILFNYKGMGLSMGVMISGWDKKGPGLYYLDTEGNRFAGDMFSVGSGSIYAYGVMDRGYDYDMSDDDAFDLARRAIYHATYRDAYSGGIVRVCHMSKTGWKVISEDDCMKLHYMYQDEKMQ